MTLLVNHLGYSVNEIKTLVVQRTDDLNGTINLFKESGELVQSFTCPATEIIEQWHTGSAGALDFSALSEPGDYYFQMGKERSLTFPVTPGNSNQRIAGKILDYFHSQRCRGKVDQFDRQVPFFGQRREDNVDVHGGWYDASGDVSKYLSHLSYTNYMAPQQTPLIVWNLLNIAEKPELPQKDQALEEALYGADFLVRMCDPEGYFYQIVFDRWSKDLKQRDICNYSTQKGIKTERWEASFRQGGGMAIAALARAAGHQKPRDYSPQTYAETAERAYAHLKENNVAYLDNGKENLIDYCCSLLAAAELFTLTGKREYFEYGLNRIEQIIALQQPRGWWKIEENSDRPFFHASDEGLPVVSLIRSMDCFESQPEMKKRQPSLDMVLRQAGGFYLYSIKESNPFGYPRQMTCSTGEKAAMNFFFPHRNESGYWWQGENARLGSLYTAAGLLRSHNILTHRDRELQQYQQNLKNWLLGLNPFNACMVEGLGQNNPIYEEDWPSSPGGICNGITSSLNNEKDIALCESEDPMHSWRWGEQWVPHGAWWTFALLGL